MRYSLLTQLTALLLLAGCSADGFVGESAPIQQEEAEAPAPIVVDGFGSNAQAATRADGQTAANLLGGKFRVFATNTNGVVFNNYQVRWEGTAELTTTNRVGWEYQGYMSRATTSALQQIKYWDLSAPRYDFVSFAGLPDDAVIDNVESNSISLNANNLDTVYIANRVSAAPTHMDAVSGVSPEFVAYGQPVKFSFRRAAARLRIGFYETIPGYAVTDVHFYYGDNADAATGTSTKTQVGLQGQFPTAANYNVTYDTGNTAHMNMLAGSTLTDNRTFGELKYGLSETVGEDAHYILHDGTADPAGEKVFLGTTSATATYAVSDEVLDGSAVESSEWHPIFPYEENTHTLSLRVDYTLVSLDGAHGTIHIEGAKAEVPVNYCTWKPNYAYTYLFKISTASAGLYPITFDAAIVEETQVVLPGVEL